MAAVFGQFILAYHAVKRALFGGSDGNAAVEWRLDAPVPAIAPPPRRAWLRNRRVVGGLALAAALELLIIFGGAYGLIAHLGHHAGHAAHVHNEGVER